MNDSELHSIEAEIMGADAPVLSAKQPSAQDKKDVLDAADLQQAAEEAYAKSPNDPAKAAAVLRARVNMSEVALDIGKKLATTPEEKAQVAGLEAQFNKAKAELTQAEAKISQLAKAQASFVALMTKKYAGIPVYGWVGIAAGTGLVVRAMTKKRG